MNTIFKIIKKQVKEQEKLATRRSSEKIIYNGSFIVRCRLLAVDLRQDTFFSHANPL